VFASVMGLWFGSSDGSFFLYNSIVKLVFHDAGIFFVYNSV
jgi:hypothetical protein